jgi:small-conductance mechanosensitive channel
MLLPTWSDVLLSSFQQIWNGIAGFLPLLIVALIVFILGWIISVALGKIVSQIVKSFQIDRVLQKIGVEESLERANFKLDSGAFIGGLVKWFFIIVFLVAAIDIVGLHQVNAFLSDVVLTYLPNVIVAVLILVAGALIADVMQRVVVGSAKAADISSAGFLGGITRWAIWIFAILAALYQLGIAGAFVQTLFTGFIAMLAIAGGLAFGLGGKDAASRYIEKLRQDIK